MNHFIQTTITIFIEILCYVLFCSIFCNIPKKRSLIFVLYISTCWIVIAFQNNFLARQFLFVTAISVISKLYNHQTLKKNFIISALFQSIIIIADLIVILLYNCFFDISDDSILNLIVVMEKAIVLFFIILFNKYFSKDTMNYLTDKQWIKFMVFPLFTIFVIAAIINNCLSNTVIIKNESLLFITWIIAAGLIGMNITLFYLINDIAKSNKELHEHRMFELESSNQLQLYNTILSDTEKQRKLSHEYKNQIQCIQTLCETAQYDELKRYLHQITDKVLHDLDRINTNHAIVNAVINVKYQETVEKNILFIFQLNDMSKLKLESEDIVILLSNLLNNAIEACEHCNTERMIKLKLILENEQLILSVWNTHENTLIPKDKSFQTTKTEDASCHGIGLQNVIHVIEKNHGDYVIIPKEHEFMISIIIPQ